jgi:hypothetical protein
LMNTERQTLRENSDEPIDFSSSDYAQLEQYDKPLFLEEGLWDKAIRYPKMSMCSLFLYNP